MRPVFEASVNLGSGALAATTLCTPFGPIGGAVCGLCGYISGSAVAWDNGTTNKMKKLAYQIPFFILYSLAIGALTRHSLTLGSAITFSLTCVGTVLAISLLIQSLTHHIYTFQKPERYYLL